jgi:putative transposase
LFLHPRLAEACSSELDRADHGGAVHAIAWVLMPDHLHWVLELRHGSLSAAIQSFKSRAARAINARVGGGGQVWQPGFHDHRVRNEEALRKHVRYTLDNPRRSGLVERLGDYPFWWCRDMGSAADLV